MHFGFKPQYFGYIFFSHNSPEMLNITGRAYNPGERLKVFQNILLLENTDIEFHGRPTEPTEPTEPTDCEGLGLRRIVTVFRGYWNKRT